MRSFLWLAIAVFISSLFWPQLLDAPGIIYSVVIAAVLLILPRLRVFAVIPIIAVYFSFYAYLTLTGSLPIPELNKYLPFANDSSLQVQVDGQNHNIIVRVNSLISSKNKGYFTAKLLAVDGRYLNYSPLLEMRWYKPSVAVQLGQIHSFRVSLKPVYGRANPAGFDRQKWRFSDHIAYQATIREHLLAYAAKPVFRADFYQQVTELSSSLSNQGIILALSFADKSLLSFATKEQLKKLTITHLFAISGLHIGLVFSCMYLLADFLLRRFFVKRYLGWNSWRFANLIALSAAFFYAYLAGFSLPTQRAFLMLLIALLILSVKRKHALFDLLTVTLLVILLYDPLSVLSLSLWLSFSAVIIILLILWRFAGVLKEPRSPSKMRRFFTIKRYLKFLLLIQFSLTFLMLPIQLLSFSAFSILSPVINLIAVPFFSLLIIPLILLGCLFSFFIPQLTLALFTIADRLLSFFFYIFDGVQAAYQVYSVSHWQIIILLISLALLMFIMHFQAVNNRMLSKLFAVVFLGFISISWWKNKQDDAAQWFVEVIDVGQGLSVLIRSQGQTLLYDTGPRYPSGFNTAATEVIPYLQALGVTQLDYLLISHSDIDHAGGFSVINETFSPKQIIVGEPLLKDANTNANVALCRAGDKWSLGGLTVDVLSPFSLTKQNNNNSCVLRVSDGSSAVLLTGDIEKKQELLLVEKSAAQLPSDLLFAAHHGSKNSSSDEFIKAVSPTWVIFSAGFMNHWGFPANEVKLRYKNQSVKMVNSGLSGFIRVKIKKGCIYMQTYREDLASYWYHHSFSL